MQRIICALLVLFALVCGEGCRRNTEKKAPILVAKEADFMYTKGVNSYVAGLKPVPKEKENAGDPDGKFAEAAQKEKERLEKLKRKSDTADIGKAYIAFRIKEKVNNHSFDKFKTYLRRQNLAELREQAESETYAITFFARLDTPGQVVLNHKSGEDGLMPAFEIAPLGPAGTTGVQTMIKDDQLKERYPRQELYVLWRELWDYSKQHYCTTPVDPRDSQRLKGLLSNPNANAALTAIAQQMPQVLKKTPDARKFELFKRYLQDNAPPDYFKVIDERLIKVNMKADLRVATDLVLARSMAEGEKGTMAISSNGAINYYQPATIDQWFPQAPPGQ